MMLTICSPKPTKKKQKVELKDETNASQDSSTKVRAIKEIFPDIEEAQILRVLSSLGHDQEKAVQYFLDGKQGSFSIYNIESAKSESVEEKLRVSFASYSYSERSHGRRKKEIRG